MMRAVLLAHEQLRVDGAVRLATDRAFGFVLSGFLAAMGLLPWLWSRPVRWPFLIAAGLVCAAAAVRAELLGPVHRLAWRAAIVLHRVTSPVLMAILFFGLMTPVAAMLRLSRSRSVGLRLDPAPEGGGYWVPREPESVSNSMELPF
jgi:hypothetical protein